MLKPSTEPNTARPSPTAEPLPSATIMATPVVPGALASSESTSVSEQDAAQGDMSPTAENRSEGEGEPQQPSNLLATLLDTDVQAVLLSLLVHVVIILALAVVPLVVVNTTDIVSFTSQPAQPIEEFTLIEDVAISDNLETEVGANSDSDNSMALSSAPVLAELSELPAPSMDPATLSTTFELNSRVQQAMALTTDDVIVKGMTGVGTTGTDGAVDQITYEILRSMEERPTLVVWFFDQSGSLQKRREEIRARFDRIYEELGIIKTSREEEAASRDKDDVQPLLTSVFAFGEQVNLLTKKPTADIAEIRAAIDSIQMDSSGTERAFSAIFKGVEKFKRYRHENSGLGPKRNVLFIAVTDEKGDDDARLLDATLHECQKFAIPVYVIGVPAPFGRSTTYVKYIDPDERFDQSPQWAEVDQGPESIIPERVKLGYRDDAFLEPVVDSGFGPYALSRLAYETNGIYFTVHPNRQPGKRIRQNQIEPFASKLEYFFDPEVMVKYRPDYVPQEEYLDRIRESPLRQALVTASRRPRVDTLRNPSVRFVKRDDASLAGELSRAQQQAARLGPELSNLEMILSNGEAHRDKEISPRWLAGFDLAFGTVIAHRVRAEVYNNMLAKAKRGMKFTRDESNTWVLKPSAKIDVGSRLERDAEKATILLKGVADKHAGTPWGLLAQRELALPIGWEWTEEVTDLNPPAERGNGNNNNNPRPPRDDQARMLQKPLPKRAPPKL